MSLSVKVVSPKPGVSIKMTCFPPTLNGADACTSEVQLSNPRPTPSDDPDTKLTNYRHAVSEWLGLGQLVDGPLIFRSQ